MSRLEAGLHHLANLLVGGSGLAFAWMLYLSEPADEFSVLNHPWQDEMQALHVVAAPVLVFACGLIWRSHVQARLLLGFPHRRRSGRALALLLGPMVLSGYLLQVVVHEDWHRLWVVLHLASSCLWILAYVVHQLSDPGEEELPELS